MVKLSLQVGQNGRKRFTFAIAITQLVLQIVERLLQPRIFPGKSELFGGCGTARSLPKSICAISPKRARRAKAGAGRKAGRCSTLPSVAVNCELVTGLGPAPFMRGECAVDGKAAHVHTRSSTWIQGIHCLPDPSCPRRRPEKRRQHFLQSGRRRGRVRHRSEVLQLTAGRATWPRRLLSPRPYRLPPENRFPEPSFR